MYFLHLKKGRRLQIAGDAVVLFEEHGESPRDGQFDLFLIPEGGGTLECPNVTITSGRVSGLQQDFTAVHSLGSPAYIALQRLDFVGDPVRKDQEQTAKMDSKRGPGAILKQAMANASTLKQLHKLGLEEDEQAIVLHYNSGRHLTACRRVISSGYVGPRLASYRARHS